MELDDLKTAWKSVEPHIETGSPITANTAAFSNKSDVKTRLIRRYLLSLAVTIIGGGLTVTSRLWAPVLLPASWLAVFGMLCTVGAIAEIYLLSIIRKINLWESTPSDVLKMTLRIRRLYKNAELVFTLAITAMFVWLLCLSPIVHSWKVGLLWIAFPISVVVELRLYRKNIRLLNKLSADINNNNDTAD